MIRAQSSRTERSKISCGCMFAAIHSNADASADSVLKTVLRNDCDCCSGVILAFLDPRLDVFRGFDNKSFALD